jgi:hypothetical protein
MTLILKFCGDLGLPTVPFRPNELQDKRNVIWVTKSEALGFGRGRITNTSRYG